MGNLGDGENMSRKGIRIRDKVNNAVSVGLHEILEEIKWGETIQWSILYLAGLGLFRDKSIPDLELEIKNYPKGLQIDWKDLKFLEEIDNRVEDLVLIGSRDSDTLKQYDNDQQMYETCDYVIVFFDSSYWEVFSKDESFIQRLFSKFQKVEFLESDFQNEYEE